jgi:heme-degrading monooxygenase HmoA
MDGSSWASGRWHVRSGKEEEFVERWTAWLSSTSKNVPGFRSARLLRSDDDPSIYVSVSEWADPGSLQTWKGSPGFEDGLGSARALTDEFVGGDFGLVSAVDPSM